MTKLARLKTRFGLITIEEDKRGARAYCQGGYYQSHADRNGVSLLIYVQAAFGLLAQTRARKILIIGCAGGSLATMLTRTGCDVTAVDINPHAFVLARRYFQLPDDVECRVADALEFLNANRKTFDAIVMDAFHGGEIADAAFSNPFYAAARRRLRRGGVLIANVHVANDADDIADRAAAQMAKTFAAVRILDRPRVRYRNVLVVAGAVRALKRPKLAMRPGVDLRRLTKALAAMRFRRRQKIV